MSDSFQQSEETPSPLGANARMFAIAMTGVAAVVVGVGWFTAVREVAYGAMISSLAFAFLPFAIVAVGLLLCVIEIGEPVVIGGFSTIKPYYRWLARQKHPAFWGTWLGVGLGGVVLFGLNAALILPGEAKTVEIMARVDVAIDEAYKLNRTFPRPNDDGHLPIDGLNGADVPVADGVVVDGFGRPFAYEVEGRWKLARWRLASVGFDGASGGGDDFCHAGSTKLGKLAETASDILTLIRSKSGGRIDGLKSRLAAIRSLRCDDQ